MRAKLREVESDYFEMGKVYMAAFFYTKNPMSTLNDGKPRVLTDGKGQFPFVEIKGLAPHLLSDSPVKNLLFKRTELLTVEQALGSDRKLDSFQREVDAIRGAAELLTYKLSLMNSRLHESLGGFYPNNTVVLELKSACVIVCAKDVGEYSCDSLWMDANDQWQFLVKQYSAGDYDWSWSKACNGRRIHDDDPLTRTLMDDVSNHYMDEPLHRRIIT